MKRPDLRAFLTPKHFSSSIELAGCTYAIELETPDLSECPHSMWGDWGPMYTFGLDDSAGVHVRYRCDARAIAGVRRVPASSIQLNSPMLWAQRQRTPFYLGFEDAEWGLRFAVYLDRRGRPSALEVKTLRPEPEIAAQLAGDLSLRDARYSSFEHLRVA